ncbi:hypothetical protein G4B84_012274 [Aspergillus flavus NRRL3357]|nr:uncharacterized protein G4B84_012274 [Aspergillus flavus NRRL3357]QMW36745.1 hypothetical protein G4B84_012274 [Aspergillus flavus NRRL3357]
MSELPKCERDFDIAYQEWERDSAEWFDQEAWDKALESWISPFLEERDFGYAILQRRRRLLSIKPAARPKCEDKSQMKSPDYQEAERKREEEVNELMEAYWTSNRTLLAMDETMPLAFNVVEIVLLRSHRDRHGRPYSWVMDPAHLWKAFVLMLIWVVTNSSRPLFVVFFDWLSVHFKYWLERMWPLPEGGSPEARPDQENKGSVGAEESEEGKKKKWSLGDSEEESDDESEGGVKLSEGSVGEKKRAWRRVWRVVVVEEEEEEEEKKFVRSDLPGYGLLAQTKDILKPRVEKLRHWRGLRREVDLEKGVRGRSKSAGPVPHQSQPKATQVEASGGAAPGDLNAIVSGLAPTMLGADPTGGQSEA